MYSTQKILIIIKILLIDAPRAFVLKILLETLSSKLFEVYVYMVVSCMK